MLREDRVALGVQIVGALAAGVAIARRVPAGLGEHGGAPPVGMALRQHAARPPARAVALRLRQAGPGGAMHLVSAGIEEEAERVLHLPDDARLGAAPAPVSAAVEHEASASIAPTWHAPSSCPRCARTVPARRATSQAAEPMRRAISQMRVSGAISAARAADRARAVPAPADRARPRPKEGRQPACAAAISPRVAAPRKACAGLGAQVRKQRRDRGGSPRRRAAPRASTPRARRRASGSGRRPRDSACGRPSSRRARP